MKLMMLRSRRAPRPPSTTKRLAALAKEVGVSLTDEQLDEISGGSWTHSCSDYEDDEWW